MAAKEPLHKPAANWDTEQRYREAERAVVQKGWTQTRAAEWFGVDRSHLSRRMAKRKRRRIEQEERGRAATEAKAPQASPGLGPLGLQERRRVPSFDVFEERYFGHLLCPDCGVRHETPPFHREITEAVLDPQSRRVLVNMPPYHRLWLETPILTANRGWQTMGSLAVGDFVFAVDGTPTRVAGKSAQITAPAWRVVFSDGSELLADEHHRWWVDPVGDMKPRFMTTGELLESGLKTGRVNRWRVPVTAPLEYPEADLPVDPYCFGAWLGDGTAVNPGLFTSADPEILDWFDLAGVTCRRQVNSQHGWVLSGGAEGRGSWRRAVLGLCPDGKRIPDLYLRASFKQRLALLQGLMDTDGTVKAATGECKFTQIPGPVLDGFVELARSLGLQAKVRLEPRPNGPIGRVEFFTDLPVFRLARKAEALEAANGRKRHRAFTHRRIVAIEPVGDLPGQCITVDHPSETFLAGRDLVPTGNSKSTLVTVKHTIYELVRNPNSRTILISKSLPFTRTFLQSINEILTNPELYEGAAGNLIDEWGPFKPEGSSSVWSKEQIYVAGRVTAEKDPTIQVLGVGQQIYGRRADRLVFDDIATLENQANPDRVAGMLEWIDKEALSRIGKNGLAVWVGTRVHHGDVYSVLQRRSGYRVLKYPCILDDETEATLWPEHFPFSQALIHRTEMSPADFQLVYQQVDIPGVGASFPPETVDACKDTSRVLGQFDPSWRMIGGLDPAGATKDSGYTALTVIGVDVGSGKRFVVDQIAEKAMKAPRMKDLMLEFSQLYGIGEWRVEVNGLQSQLIQYDQELIKRLALQGTRVVPHRTGKNKWDPQFGVEGMAPLMTAGLFSIPWGNAPTAQKMQPLIDELIAFPMGRTSDRVMSLWFCDNGARDLLRRDHLPMFNERLSKNWPARVKRRRRVVDFEAREVRRVPISDQRPGELSVGQRGYRRVTVGGLTPHDQVGKAPPPQRTPLVNVEGHVEP